MGFFDQVGVAMDDPDRQELLRLLRGGFPDKPAIGVLIARVGLASDEVNWDQSVAGVWADVFDKLVTRGRLRQLVYAAMADPNAAGSLGGFDALLARIGDPADPVEPPDHTAAQIIRGRPFVDREVFRSTVRRLACDDPLDGPVLVVAGGRESGRSYTWNLISHVGQRSRRFVPRLIDLSAWEDLASIGPMDVARDLAEQLNWMVGDMDPTAQPATQARVVLSKFKGWVANFPGQLWLVFDGLDSADLPPAALRLVAGIAAAAQNGELQDVRVVLVGLEHPVPGVDFDPLLSRQVMSDVPPDELRDFLVRVAAQGGYELKAEEADTLLVELFGEPLPDLVPVRLLDSRFIAVVRRLAGVQHG